MILDLGRKYVKNTEVRTVQYLDNDMFDLFDDGDSITYADHVYTVKKEYSPKTLVFTNKRDQSVSVEVGEYLADYDGVLEAMTENQVSSYLVPMLDSTNIYQEFPGADLLATFVEVFNSVSRRTDKFLIEYTGANGHVSVSSNQETGMFDLNRTYAEKLETTPHEDLHDALMAFLLAVMVAKT